LDNWPTKFRGIHVLKNMGGGLAPWNTIKFKINKSNNSIFLLDKETNINYELVFFHFHGMRFFKIGKIFTFASTRNYVYDLEKGVLEIIYKKYFSSILKEYRIVSGLDITFNRGFYGLRDYLSNNLYNYGYRVKRLFLNGK